MSHRLKLNVYILELKKVGQSKYSTWQDFYNNTYGIDFSDEKIKENQFSLFNTAMLNSFGASFTSNDDSTKGVSLKTIDMDAKMNVFSGTFKGGLTGIDQEIFYNNNSNERTGFLTYDHIATLIYYFKIWTPYDSNIGILMLQSYSSLGCNAEIVKLFKGYFKKVGYLLKLSRFVPREIVDHFKSTSSIYKISFERKNLDSNTRNKLSPIYEDFPKVNAKIELTGFKVSPDNLWNALTSKNIKLLESDIVMLGMTDNDYKTMVYYEDAEGHKSKLVIDASFGELKPNIFLPDTLKEEDKEVPHLERINIYTNSILDKIKKEIGYAAKDNS